MLSPLGSANGSLATWIINKLVFADVEAVSIITSVVPADATRIMCDAAVTAVAGSVESAVVIVMIVVKTARVIYDVVVQAAAWVRVVGGATVIITPFFGAVTSKLGATEVICGVVLVVIAAGSAKFMFSSVVAITDTAQIICGVAVLRCCWC